MTLLSKILLSHTDFGGAVNSDFDWSITQGYNNYFGHDRVERYVTDSGRRAVVVFYLCGFKVYLDRRLRDFEEARQLVLSGYDYRGSDYSSFQEKINGKTIDISSK